MILVTDHYTTEALEHLKRHTKIPVVITEHRPTREHLQSAQALLIRSRTIIDADLLEKSPQLKVIVTATSGYDHIDLQLCEKRGVAVMYTPDANAKSAAELTMYLMLACLRQVGHVQQQMRETKWKDTCPQGSTLSGQTVGVLGLGRVGSHVAHLAQNFGAEVVAYDPYQKDEVFNKLGLTRQGLTEVLVQSTLLTLHVPLTRETRHFINAQTLSIAQHGLILINTSRGSVVDERALVAALDSGQIAAAGIDVFEHEPLAKESRLRKFKQAILTPHIGAFTHDAFDLASKMAVDSLIGFLSQGEIKNTPVDWDHLQIKT